MADNLIELAVIFRRGGLDHESIKLILMSSQRWSSLEVDAAILQTQDVSGDTDGVSAARDAIARLVPARVQKSTHRIGLRFYLIPLGSLAVLTATWVIVSDPAF